MRKVNQKLTSQTFGSLRALPTPAKDHEEEHEEAEKDEYDGAEHTRDDPDRGP